MTKKQLVQAALLKQKMLPLYFNKSVEVSIGILEALYNAGVRVVEYTNRGEAALQNFKQLKKVATEKMPGLFLGIGTIKTAEQANHFIEAGVDFVVCPTINTEVGALTQNANLLWIPGCMTPTEIATAEAAGAEIIKIFPGNILGPGYISAIQELFPQIKFMPTGGVEVEAKNLGAWFKAGVVAVGMGSKLVSKKVVDEKDYEGLQEATKNALQLVQQASISK